VPLSEAEGGRQGKGVRPVSTALRLDYGFVYGLVVVVAVVLVVLVADVSVIVVIDVSVVIAVSVVIDVSVIITVSVSAVSTVTFSSRVHAANIATQARTISVKTNDFFIFQTLLFELGAFEKLQIRMSGCLHHLISHLGWDPCFARQRSEECDWGARRSGRRRAVLLGRRLTMSSTHTAISFDGTTIHYDFYDAAVPGLVVVVPGFWRDRKHPAMTRLARFLSDAGYRVAVVDVRGHGSSGGTYGFNLHEHHDVAAVIRQILQNSTIESVMLLGLSYGGAIAVSTAARHDLPISSLLLISAVADFAMIAPRINLFTMHRHIALRQALKKPRFNWRTRRSAKLRALDDIRDVHIPLCLIHVKEDWLIHHSHSEALFDQAHEPKELHILDITGNYHADRIFSVAQTLIEPLVLDFLRRGQKATSAS
jgi:alpha-beta hydrolase superfamily lysophospholipase